MVTMKQVVLGVVILVLVSSTSAESTKPFECKSTSEQEEKIENIVDIIQQSIRTLRENEKKTTGMTLNITRLFDLFQYVPDSCIDAFLTCANKVKRSWTMCDSKMMEKFQNREFVPVSFIKALLRVFSDSESKCQQDIMESEMFLGKLIANVMHAMENDIYCTN